VALTCKAAKRLAKDRQALHSVHGEDVQVPGLKQLSTPSLQTHSCWLVFVLQYAPNVVHSLLLAHLLLAVAAASATDSRSGS
jgi:hypothetical protein